MATVGTPESAATAVLALPGAHLVYEVTGASGMPTAPQEDEQWSR